jgi:hypothetical protein
MLGANASAIVLRGFGNLGLHPLVEQLRFHLLPFSLFIKNFNDTMQAQRCQLSNGFEQITGQQER